ncbi:MAG: amidohydrolase family protein [Lewinellaceae bacterium]|nr:amidohydrolase family protein [Phaeodactylibacter sp.]MCB0613805.1 amidohydrolase family protein [Phaeodactylibacter sp.]MCB9349740.1 amidohydrolase family protein [Lewinellaceae bacterium]MCB9352737.1 amidohydrolase family protein [Lewinellaceae bacterium]
MTIDAHQHFWRYNSSAYAWINEELNLLQRDFMPPGLEILFRQNGIDGCVAVEARGSELENSFLLELAREFHFIKGVVGWLDLRAGQLSTRLDYYRQFPAIKGFRYNVQMEEDVNFLLRPKWLTGMQVLASFDFTFDLLVFPHQLGAALELAKRFPNQQFVIDHLAKPYIKDGFFDGWAVLMKAMAVLPNVWCKVSGMVTEANWSGWKYEDFVPYLSHLFECFGPGRLMFGSDWPVCLLAAEYGQVKGILERFMEPLSEEAKQKVWADNAIEFYQLNA